VELKVEENEISLLDARSYFIGDRVVLSQVLFFLFAGFFTLLIEVEGISGAIIPMWWLFCLILPLAGIIYIDLKKEPLYFDHSWKMLFWLLCSIWVPLTVYLGVLIDDAFAGVYNAFWLSLFLAMIYGTGYELAKLFRIKRNSYSSGADLVIRMILVSIIIIASTSVVGGLLYSSALQSSGLGYGSFFAILSCQSCVLSVYIIIAGVGIVASMALHYYMLYCLYEPKGITVGEDPPNYCYLRIMTVSLILALISWLLMLILFPPIPAGGGGKGKKGIRFGGRTHHTIYTAYRNYGEKEKRYPPESVEEEWQEYDLGKQDA
jgi:hypothetical protein